MQRKYIVLGLQTGGTILLLGLLIRDFDWQQFVVVAGQVPLWFYVWSCALVGLGQLVYVYKWQVVLRGLGWRIPIMRLAEQYFISLFFNNFLPTSFGGDVSKVYYLGRTIGYGDVTASVICDRFISFLFIALIATISSWTIFVSSLGFYVVRSLLTLVTIGLVATMLAILYLRIDRMLLAIQPRLPRLRRILDSAAAMIVRVRRVLKQRKVVAVSLGSVVVYYALVTVVYRAFFQLTTGIDPPMVPVISGVTGIALLANVPISVNGIGLREQLHFLIFGSVGISKEAAVAVSLLVFTQLMVYSLFGCVLWLRLRFVAKAGWWTSAPRPL